MQGGGALKIVLGPHSGVPCGVFRDGDRKGRVRVSPDTSPLAAFPPDAVKCRGKGRRLGGLWSWEGLATCKAVLAVVSSAEKELGSLGLGAPCHPWNAGAGKVSLGADVCKAKGEGDVLDQGSWLNPSPVQ